MTCKGWIAALYPQRKEALTALLSHHDAQVFSALPDPVPLNQEHLKSELLDRVHFSWLAPFLRTLASSEIPLFLGALSKPQSDGLAEILGYGGPLPTLTKVGKQALRQMIHSQLLHNQELVPLAFLPESTYTSLLNLTPHQLARLVRFLGLHDLAFEMRQIIATKELKRIFSSLTKKEGDYLNPLLLHREPLVFKRLFLEKWDGTKEHLHKLLDERGLNRLGHAVHEESESCIWYLTHQLDMHQGALLLKHKKKPTHARGDEILKRQVEALFKEAV